MRINKKTLAEIYPKLMPEWDYDKNSISPFDITTRASYRCQIHWKCDKNHKWSSTISNRKNKEIGCPFCLRLLNNKESNITITNKELVKDWDFEKNGYIVPEMFTSGSGTKVWWKCKFNHSWQAAIYSRVSGGTCPYCLNRKIDENNNLLATDPILCKEWDFEKNESPEMFVRGSGKKVWWICSNNANHRWQSIINTRAVLGVSCPFCTNKVADNSNNLTTTHPKLCSEWDYVENDSTPEQCTFGSSKKVSWICSINSSHKWKATVNSRTTGKGNGCPYCAHKISDEHTNLVKTNPDLCLEWNYSKNIKKPSEYTFGSSEKVWWVCLNNNYHEWEATISNRTTRDSGCPYCCNKTADQFNNITITHPELCLEWNFSKNNSLPQEYTYGSQKKIWWICLKNKNHIWETTVSSRAAAETGCPYCKQSFGENYTRYSFQKIFQKSFPRIRPNFLKNIQTNCNLELDGFCEELMIAFEYQGGQHEKIVPIFNMTQEDLEKRKLYDQFKRNKCKEFGVKLIEIPEFSKSFRKEDFKLFIIKQCSDLNITLPENINDIKISYFDFQIENSQII